MPSVIGPYRIVESLGSGANGEVFLAKDTRLRRKVAVKTLSGYGSRELGEARRWVLREARAAARLNHPNIAAVYDVLESADGAHIIMEYVQGQTLAARLREGPLPPDRVLEIAIQLTDALAAAHALGVVHRDLKPANVVITPEGTVKVLDFGLAKVRPVDSTTTPAPPSSDLIPEGRQVGTPPYMPPEHLMGEPADVRGDIYSLGVVLFELLTGRRPFQGPDAMALSMAILTAPTPRASNVDPTVPAALDAVVYRAMSRIPQDRYGSVTEMAADLRRAAGRRDEGDAAAIAAGARPGFTEAATKSRAERHRRRWWLARPSLPRAAVVGGLAAVVALVLYAALHTRVHSQPPPRPVVAVLPLAASGENVNESLGTGIADVLITALSNVPEITVVSRAATLKYRERKEGLDRIARELGATHIVDGTLQRSGEKLRVNISLVPASSKLVAWSSTYDGSFDKLFELQQEVSTAVAEALRGKLSAEERQRLQKPATTNVEALADYAQARTFVERPDVSGNLERSIALFQSAIAKDPGFARAYAGLGEAYWRRYLETKEPAWVDKARGATGDALRLDPDDASVHRSQALILKDTGHVDEAEKELRRAITLQPNSDEAHSSLGVILAGQGRLEEGVAELRRAISLRPNFWGSHYNLGWVDYQAGRYDEAAAAFRRVTELQPDNSWGFLFLGTVLDAAGDKHGAEANYNHAIELGHAAAAYTNLGHLLYAEGRMAEAARAFEEAARRAPNVPAHHRNLGDLYEKLGQHEKARQSYLRAAELSREHLRTNPRDAATLAMLAVYEAKLGLGQEAQDHAARAVALSPASGEALYRQAVVKALAGKPDESLDALEQALKHGYSATFVLRDDDLASLRERPRFHELLTQSSAAGSKGGAR